MLITENMRISEVVEQYPQTVAIFRDHGMGCLGCAAARFENIGQGAAAHGIDITTLINALNKAIENNTSD
ncbi:DUF1858 domain-containing protein [Pelosinus fermentans]|uniref:DUF1858 domain-containing protein n=1 Tax=Pelosinus fermentans JBW45 TaxID=1192197 RepID=I9DLH7_9FIRM|nr:DUF1858 domain-containing protein [Pelosinus fermentans]AJQ27365.1 Conserved hypothetical protein CHP03980, redox-disulfide [Pelosinus fermentans JBW45]